MVKNCTMAWLDLAPSGVYKIAFRFGDRKFKQFLETSNPQFAEKSRLRVEENLRLVEQGRLDVPVGIELVEFLLYDGKLTPAISVVGALPPIGAVAANGNGHLRTSQNSTPSDGTDATSSARDSAATDQSDSTPLLLATAFDNYLAAMPENALAPEMRRVAKITCRA